MFKQRLISGIILVIIAFVTLYYGGFLTFFVVGAISLIGVFELLRVIHMEKSALGVIVYTDIILFVITSWIRAVYNATGTTGTYYADSGICVYFS